MFPVLNPARRLMAGGGLPPSQQTTGPESKVRLRGPYPHSLRRPCPVPGRG